MLRDPGPVYTAYDSWKARNIISGAPFQASCLVAASCIIAVMPSIVLQFLKF